MIELLSMMPQWAAHLVISLTLVTTVGSAGFIVARAGITPLWALALLVPFVNVLVIWLFAYARWPGRVEGSSRPADEAG